MSICPYRKESETASSLPVCWSIARTRSWSASGGWSRNLAGKVATPNRHQRPSGENLGADAKGSDPLVFSGLGGSYVVAIKVIDIFGNDTMTLLPVRVG